MRSSILQRREAGSLGCLTSFPHRHPAPKKSTISTLGRPFGRHTSIWKTLYAKAVCNGREVPNHGNGLEVLVSVDDRVETGQQLVILESMKMEFPIEATQAGVVDKVAVSEGTPV